MQRLSKERRHFTRLPVNFTVKFDTQDHIEDSAKAALSKNISPNGILFTSNKAIPVSTYLSLDITPPGFAEPILAEGKVMRVEEVSHDELYNIGIAFTKINLNEFRVIQEYIRATNLNNILELAIKNNASDIHLIANQPPIIRVFGKLSKLGSKSLEAEEIKDIIYGFLTDAQIEKFEKELELDVSLISGQARFRVNIYKDKGELGAALRYIPSEVKTLEELGLPPILADLALRKTGLILVTGPTGSGKSTTLAAMIDIINKNRTCVIVGLEDPVEYLHIPNKSILIQREIGTDSLSFINGLKHALRQDVNVILVGEMRDIESFYIALIASETGHLVLSTMQTSDVISSINRIIDIFPPIQQQQIRLMLADNLKGVITQVLVQREDNQQRVAATEVLVVTDAVANLIRQGQLSQIVTNIELGAKQGMHLMDTSLEALYKQGIISRETVLTYAKNPLKFL
ncbi:MAG: PilT/PilU family type 4a pilus ATPase [Candidatus Omnitrophica bacterium]|nr:PilT/PilU family type 4a pilus ATPase [Candidatus Omnitrophota bacterium]